MEVGHFCSLSALEIDEVHRISSQPTAVGPLRVTLRLLDTFPPPDRH